MFGEESLELNKRTHTHIHTIHTSWCIYIHSLYACLFVLTLCIAFIGLHWVTLHCIASHRSTAVSSGRLWRRKKREIVSLRRNTRLYYHHPHPHPRHLVYCCLHSLYLRSSPLLAPFDQTMANMRNTIISLVIQLIQQLQL